MKIALSLVLALTPLFAFAKTPNDPFFWQQWYLDKIGASAAWEYATGAKEVVVAVIDTGVDLNHPDLAGNIWVNKDEVPGDGVDNDLNGFVDDVHGWDFVDKDNDPMAGDAVPFDPSAVSHGTFVAGIVGAIGDNTEGVSGIAWNVSVMPLRTLNALGSGTEDDAIAALNYAVANGARVINLSFTGEHIDATFTQAIRRAYEHGVVVVAAVGNDGRGENGDLDIHPVYPACLKSAAGDDWVIGVAASDREDRKADFSNYGRDCTDLAAPGLNMFATEFQSDLNPWFSDYYGGNWQGTSAAAPVISGSVALLLSRHPSLTPAKVKTVLQLSVDPLKTSGTLFQARVGAGRVNIGRAMEIARFFAPAVVRGQTTTRFVLTQGPGGKPEVNILDAFGNHLASYLVFDESVTGGVSAEISDIDRDGEPEFVVVPRSGAIAHVRWFELGGALGGQFTAYDESIKDGFSVTVGDIEGDGSMEIIVASRTVADRPIRIFDLQGNLKGEFVHRLASGVTLSAGDVDGKVGDEIIAASLTNGSLAIHKGLDGTLVNSFAAFEGAKGISVALGDTDGNGRKEILAAARAENGAVRVFSYQGALLSVMTSTRVSQVAGGDLDADGTDEVFASDAKVEKIEIFRERKLDETWDTRAFSGAGVEVRAWTL